MSPDITISPSEGEINFKPRTVKLTAIQARLIATDLIAGQFVLNPSEMLGHEQEEIKLAFALADAVKKT